MNKKVNTLLFVLGATVFNIIVMIVILFGGLAILGRVLPTEAQESVGRYLFFVLFLLSIGGSFYLYHKIMKYLSAKIDMDKYFHPIFRPGNKKRE